MNRSATTDRRPAIARQLALVGAACASLLILNGYLGLRYHQAQREFATRSHSADQVAVDVATLLANRSGSVLARSSADEEPAIQTAVEAALNHVGVPADRLLRTSPLPARNAPEGQPQEHAFRLTLTPVSMEQIARFCARMLENEPVLRLRSLHLRSSDDSAWQLDATFAWLQ